MSTCRPIIIQEVSIHTHTTGEVPVGAKIFVIHVKFDISRYNI